MTGRELIGRYYEAFNAGDAEGMLACVTDDIEHRVNEGEVRHGREAFADFCSHMGVSYREELRDMVIFVTEDGTRGLRNSWCTARTCRPIPACPRRRARPMSCPRAPSSTCGTAGSPG